MKKMHSSTNKLLSVVRLAHKSNIGLHHQKMKLKSKHLPCHVPSYLLPMKGFLATGTCMYSIVQSAIPTDCTTAIRTERHKLDHVE